MDAGPRCGNHTGGCAGREQVPQALWDDAPSTNTELTPGTAYPRRVHRECPDRTPGARGDDGRSAAPNPRREMPRARSPAPAGGCPKARPAATGGGCPDHGPHRPRSDAVAGKRCPSPREMPLAWPRSPTEPCPSPRGRCPSPTWGSRRTPGPPGPPFPPDRALSQ